MSRTAPQVSYPGMTPFSYDTPFICITDLFPGKSVEEATIEMMDLARVVEYWLQERSAFRGRISFMNILEKETNPEGHNGYFRIYGP